MATSDATYVGHVASVIGSIVRVRLRDDMPSNLVLVKGETYRIGQIGSFFRIPLGYTNLYAVCTQVGADALPFSHSLQALSSELEEDIQEKLSGYRWVTVALFGESVGTEFERGIGQYPTVGDEVHVVTNNDLTSIYSWTREVTGTVTVGRVASTRGIPAEINISKLVSRHCAVVGSTGAGKSNLVTVLLESISDSNFPNARVVVIDPHGEYASALNEIAQVFRSNPKVTDEKPLRVPFWALPFNELQHLTLGDLNTSHEATIRDAILKMKSKAVPYLKRQPSLESLSADSPVPFSIKQLWFDLDRFERVTFSETNQIESTECPCEEAGDPERLKPAKFPTATPYNQPPYQNKQKRNIERQLNLMKSRILDGRYSFLFNPDGGFTPDLYGKVEADLDALVGEWIGHDLPISVFDMSSLPSEMLPTIVGTILRVIYDIILWGQDLDIGGRNQPLLVVIDEAHLFIPDGDDSLANRMLSMLAKEGRKYGIGLVLVSQRPSELDGTVLSQCGSFIAMRLTNASDQSRVAQTVPDDLGGLVDSLPSLRTGEGIFLGEIVPIPTRVRVRKAHKKLIGDDPKLPEAWQRRDRPDISLYANALSNWRAQSRASGTP